MLKPYMKQNSKISYFWKLPGDWWHDISSILLPPLGALNGELPVCCYWLRDVWPEHVHQLRPLLTACKHSVRGHLFPNSTSTNQLPQAHLYHAKLSSRNDVANNSFFCITSHQRWISDEPIFLYASQQIATPISFF